MPNLMIEDQKAQQVLDYLVGRPYRETFQLVPIMVSLSPISTAEPTDGGPAPQPEGGDDIYVLSVILAKLDQLEQEIVALRDGVREHRHSDFSGDKGITPMRL